MPSAFTSALGEYDEACRQHDTEMDGTRHALAAALRRLGAELAALAHLRAAGLANATRFPLSRTAAQFANLTSSVA